MSLALGNRLFLSRSSASSAWVLVAMLSFGGCSSSSSEERVPPGDPGEGPAGGEGAAAPTPKGPDGEDDPDEGEALPSSARVCKSFPERSGEASYSPFVDRSVHCSFDPTTETPAFVAAIGSEDFGDGGVCGACARVAGPDGAATVRIVELCPGCTEGELDLSPEAFDHIASLEDGRVRVTWQLVACEPKGSITLRFRDVSDSFMTSLQVDNHRHAIRSLEYREARADRSSGEEPSGSRPLPDRAFLPGAGARVAIGHRRDRATGTSDVETSR